MNCLANCTRCPRLVAHLATVQQQHPAYHNAPVGQWGARQPKVLAVGLAPGLHGANRTARAFVGDSSGSFLFQALAATGFASHPEPERARLNGLAITNAVKCLPPQNRVLAQELRNCQSFLDAELQTFWSVRMRQPRVILALGGVAWRACWQALQRLGFADQLALSAARFGHGQQIRLARNLVLVGSFHPSRQNVNTGRLNQAMLQQVLRKVRRIIMLP